MIVVAAPSNLGLRPLRPGREAGTWRAPGGAVAAIDIGTARTPPVVYERVAAAPR